MTGDDDGRALTRDTPPAAMQWRVVLIAVVVAVVATIWSAGNDLMTLYADARSHLTISRRLIDGPNPGVVQLGTVWLPLPHLLLIPTVALRGMWQSGWAVLPLNALCLAAQALAVFKIAAQRWTVRVAWVCTAVLLSSASLLYVHTTAFTEPVLLAAMTVTIASLHRWSTSTKAYSGGEMAVFCGLPAAAGVLARYDGWAMAFVCTGVVWWMAMHRWGDRRYALKMTIGFATLPAVAACWWLWFNWVNFGDALEFQRGQYSAQAQQQVLEDLGQLPESGNLWLSVTRYLDAVLSALGWLPIVLAAAGICLWTIAWVKGQRRSSDVWIAVLLLVPFAFYVWSLFSGQIAVRTDVSDTASLFNIRYGLAVLPGLSLTAGPLFHRLENSVTWRGAMVAACAVVALGSFAEMVVAPGWRSTPIIAEGLQQRSAGHNQYTAAEWMSVNARTGRILIDDSINPLLPVLDADLDRVIAPFSTDWNQALRDPATAEWVYVDGQNPNDAVGKAVAADTDFADQFEIVHNEEDVVIYRRKVSDAD